MVVTCENGNFKLPHSNFCKISFFLLFGENFSFQKNFCENFREKVFIFSLRKFSREDFHFFFVKIFFSVSVISLVYILCISKTIKQSKTFRRKFLWIFCFGFTFQQSARTSFYWKRGYFGRL